MRGARSRRSQPATMWRSRSTTCCGRRAVTLSRRRSSRSRESWTRHTGARRVGAGPPRARFVARADRVPRARPPSQVSGGARRSDGRSRSDGCDGARGAGWDGDGLPRLRHRDGGDLGRLRFLRRRASPPPETSTPSQRALSHLLASLCTSPSTPPLPLAPPWSPPHHPPSSAIPAPPSPHPSPLPAAVIMSVNNY